MAISAIADLVGCVAAKQTHHFIGQNKLISFLENTQCPITKDQELQVRPTSLPR